MQRYLYIARHAHALDDAASDAERALSPKGYKQMARLAKGLDAKELFHPETVWHSGLLRARQTAETLLEGLQIHIPLAQKDGLAPYDEPADIADELNALDKDCLVVGHQPNLSLLASLLLLGGGAFQGIVFAKASVLCLSRIKVGAQATPWQIEWHLSHKFFKR